MCDHRLGNEPLKIVGEDFLALNREREGERNESMVMKNRLCKASNSGQWWQLGVTTTGVCVCLL